MLYVLVCVCYVRSWVFICERHPTQVCISSTEKPFICSPGVWCHNRSENSRQLIITCLAYMHCVLPLDSSFVFLVAKNNNRKFVSFDSLTHYICVVVDAILIRLHTKHTTARPTYSPKIKLKFLNILRFSFCLSPSDPLNCILISFCLFTYLPLLSAFEAPTMHITCILCLISHIQFHIQLHKEKKILAPSTNDWKHRKLSYFSLRSISCLISHRGSSFSCDCNSLQIHIVRYY